MVDAYLTIDDAPSADFTEKQAALIERDIPALLFSEGHRLADQSALATDALAVGFHIGNHTHSHARASELSPPEFEAELRRCEAEIQAAYDSASVSRPARVFRFPYGDAGGENAPAFQEILADLGFRPPRPPGDSRQHFSTGYDWAWTVDVADWALDDRDELEDQVEAVTETLRAPGTEILLLHDACNSTEIFAAFLDMMLERGIEFGDPLALLD